jgi:hypothetical protein
MKAKEIRGEPKAWQHARRSLAVVICVALFALAASRRSVAQASAEYMALIEEFFRLNDARLYAQSAKLFAEDATLDTWAEGVNGRHWQERHAAGRTAIRPFLEGRGFHKSQDRPDGPKYEIKEATQAGNTISFMLRPDRRSPEGRNYNPFSMKITFVGECIQSMSSSEFISWM